MIRPSLCWIVLVCRSYTMFPLRFHSSYHPPNSRFDPETSPCLVAGCSRVSLLPVLSQTIATLKRMLRRLAWSHSICLAACRIVLKRVPIIVCVAYPIVDDFVRPNQPLSRASNSTPANIDGFSAIWYETCLRGSEFGARKMCPANLARLSTNSCEKGFTLRILRNPLRWKASSFLRSNWGQIYSFKAI